MKKRWFKHGKWPKFLSRLHMYTIVSFGLLMVTGIALVNPRVHTVLIPYLPYIYQVHIILGLVFAITLIAPFLPLIPKGKSIRRLDWFMPVFLGGIIVVTGILIWLVTAFPTSWRSAGFIWHGRVSYILGIWILVHAFYKAFGYRPAADGINRKMQPERRAFLRWLGGGLLGSVLLTVVDPASLLSRLIASPESPAAGGNTIATRVPSFPEYYTVTGQFPQVEAAKYRLTVDGLVARPVTLSLADIERLARVSENANFHCVTGWSVANLEWTGLHLSSLAKLTSPLSRVTYVNFYSFDGAYTESMRLSQALDPSVLLAYRLDGKPLRVEQGYPVRLVVPKMYGYKSIKWVSRVEFTDKPVTGYWEARGYPTEAYMRNQL